MEDFERFILFLFKSRKKKFLTNFFLLATSRRTATPRTWPWNASSGASRACSGARWRAGKRSNEPRWSESLSSVNKCLSQMLSSIWMQVKIANTLFQRNDLAIASAMAICPLMAKLKGFISARSLMVLQLTHCSRSSRSLHWSPFRTGLLSTSHLERSQISRMNVRMFVRVSTRMFTRMFSGMFAGMFTRMFARMFSNKNASNPNAT